MLYAITKALLSGAIIARRPPKWQSALSGYAVWCAECPLSGVKRTSLIRVPMSTNDPKRTFEGAMRRGLMCSS